MRGFAVKGWPGGKEGGVELVGCGPGVGIGELDVSRPVTLRG